MMKQLIEKWFENHSQLTAENFEFVKYINETFDKKTVEIDTNKEVINKIPAENFPKSITKAILHILRSDDTGHTSNELLKIITKKANKSYSKDSIYVALHQLRKKKLVHCSTTNPKIYYLSTNSDPQVKELLKNAIGVKVNNK